MEDYYEIDYGEFNRLWYQQISPDKIIVPFTENQIDIINKSIESIHVSFGHYKGGINIYSRKNCKIAIYQIKDEWFLIFPTSTRDGEKYYKCDQFYGLLKCIKDNYGK